MKPLSHEIEIDVPIAELYGAWAGEDFSILLDSARNAYGMGRYSFVLRRPFLRLVYKNGQGLWSDAAGKSTSFCGPLWPELKKKLAEYAVSPQDFPLAGGAAGYFAYDLAYGQEKLPGLSTDDQQLPDCCLGFYDVLLAYDHEAERCFILSTGLPEHEPQRREARAAERLAEWLKDCAAALKLKSAKASAAQPDGEYRSNFSREEYCRMVERGIEYIRSGDIFQVNLSQRFSAHFTGDSFALYRYLRQINPAPFAAYLKFADLALASASPERFFKLRGSLVESRPIKGTRPRGCDAQEDEVLRDELWRSEKDRAELVMIIDLMRNDLGKVCRYGSVKVPEVFRVEEYATVFHLVSTVTGELREDCSAVDQLAAAFPPGSITGAPKVRAMEIIDELEPQRRNIYTGSVGYLSFCGNADFNVAIRTMVFKENEVFFQAGGGIVADSKPEAEYQETLDKAKALLAALGYAAKEEKR